MKELQQEIINNDQLKAKIKQLKQIIESSNGQNNKVKNNLDYIRETYFNNIDYSEMIIEIGKIIENNKLLIEDNEEKSYELKILNKEVQKLRNIVNNYEKLQNEYNSFNSDRQILQNNLSELSLNYQRNLNELQNLQYRNNELEKENVTLKNEIERIEFIKQENEKFSKTISELKDKNNNLIYDNSYLKDYQIEYDKLTREKIHLKEEFDELKKENQYYLNQYNKIKEYLNNHNNIEKINEELRNEIKNLTKKNEYLESEKTKNENYYKEKIKMIEKEKELLEKMLIKNQKLETINNSTSSKTNSITQEKYNYTNYNNFNNLNTKKYIEENEFFAKVLNRIIKYHINKIEVKNIICELLNTYEKRIFLEEQVEREEREMEQSFKYDISNKQKSGFQNDKILNKKQLNEIIQKIDLLQNMLKQYEK
jgi:hypothetical protein